NPQAQPQVTWPAAFPVVRSYLDQLVRGNGLPAARTREIAAALDAAEQATGSARAERLNQLAAALDRDAAGAADAERVRAMAAAVRDLANASRGGEETAPEQGRREYRRKGPGTSPGLFSCSLIRAHDSCGIASCSPNVMRPHSRPRYAGPGARPGPVPSLSPRRARPRRAARSG